MKTRKWHIGVRVDQDPTAVVEALCPPPHPKLATRNGTLAVIDLRSLPRWKDADAIVNTGRRLQHKALGNSLDAMAWYRDWFLKNGWQAEAPWVDLLENGSARWRKNGFLVTLEIQTEEVPRNRLKS